MFTTRCPRENVANTCMLYALYFLSRKKKKDIKERGKDKRFFLYHLSRQNGIFLPFEDIARIFSAYVSILHCHVHWFVIKIEYPYANEWVLVVN